MTLVELVVRPKAAQLVPAPAKPHALVNRMDEFGADELMRIPRLLVVAEDLQMPALDPRDRADTGPVAVHNLHPLADRREQLAVELLLVSSHCSFVGQFIARSPSVLMESFLEPIARLSLTMVSINASR